MRHRANAGQRLAAKAETGNLKHAIAAIAFGQFRGGVTLNRQRQCGGAHTMPIILNQNEALAAVAETDINLCGARINGIFNKLFHRTGRTLHHFTGGDAVNHFLTQAANFNHSSRPFPRDNVWRVFYPPRRQAGQTHQRPNRPPHKSSQAENASAARQCSHHRCRLAPCDARVAPP